MTSYKQPSNNINIPCNSICNYNKNKTVTLGNYKIRKKSIGKGSFSKIYIGNSILTGEQIAVKIIKKANVKNENTILREIKIMSTITHKHILCLLDVLVSNNKYYLIMEYCNLGDLKEYMKHRDLNEKELKYYMTQIRDGMWELHKNNIIHRDLKPQNILVTDNDCLKISDFGFAKSYNPDTDLQQTMCGSPLYMAPEILEQKKYTDMVDLWSIGVIMYELYFNKVPVNGANIIDLIKNIRRFKFNPPKNKTDSCSSNCIILMKHLLKINTNKRCSWDEFYNNKWFSQKNEDELHNKEFNKEDKYDNTVYNMSCDLNINVEDDDYENENDDDYENENDDDTDTCLFKMDEDENVLYRSNVTITNNYLKKNDSDNNYYMEDEYFDDNYVIITSPSEMDIYSQTHIKSVDHNSHSDSNKIITNQTEGTVNYVRMKRIFNSLKDSISYMFRAKSI